MEDTKQQILYLLQYTPSCDQQNLKSLFLPVSETYKTFYQLLKASPEGPLRHLRAIGRILCCCISIMNTLPRLLGMWVSPSAPESVNNTFPVLFDIIIELGPSRSWPSYQFTSSASEQSLELTAIMDCLSRSATQQVFLGASNAIDRIWPLILVSSFSCPYVYLMISPLQLQMSRLSSISMGEYSGEFIYSIFSVLVSENMV